MDFALPQAYLLGLILLLGVVAVVDPGSFSNVVATAKG
jgi:hypothetical protein